MWSDTVGEGGSDKMNKTNLFYWEYGHENNEWEDSEKSATWPHRAAGKIKWDHVCKMLS